MPVAVCRVGELGEGGDERSGEVLSPRFASTSLAPDIFDPPPTTNNNKPNYNRKIPPRKIIVRDITKIESDVKIARLIYK